MPGFLILYKNSLCSKYGANSCDFCVMNSAVDAKPNKALSKGKKTVATGYRDLPLN